MRSSRYPPWSVYLAGCGAFGFLLSLLALMLLPPSEPPSVLERLLWGALVLAFLALLPLFFLRLKEMVIRLGRMPADDKSGTGGDKPKAQSQRAGDNRDDNP